MGLRTVLVHEGAKSNFPPMDYFLVDPKCLYQWGQCLCMLSSRIGQDMAKDINTKDAARDKVNLYS